MTSTAYSRTDLTKRDGEGVFVIDSAATPVVHWMVTSFITDGNGVETTTYEFFDQPGAGGVATVPTGVVQPYRDLTAVTLAATNAEVTADGTIAAGAASVTVANVGAATATVAGGPLRVGASVTFSANRVNEILGAIAYTVNGSTLKLVEVR